MSKTSFSLSAFCHDTTGHRNSYIFTFEVLVFEFSVLFKNIRNQMRPFKALAKWIKPFERNKSNFSFLT